MQTNLDFESEADMVKKFKGVAGLAAVGDGPVHNSPFKEGKPVGFKAIAATSGRHRSRTLHVLPFVFEDGFGFERYADCMLDVPMYFVYRDGKYVDASAKV